MQEQLFGEARLPKDMSYLSKTGSKGASSNIFWTKTFLQQLFVAPSPDQDMYMYMHG